MSSDIMAKLTSFVESLPIELHQEVVSGFLEWRDGGVSFDEAIIVQAQEFAQQADLKEPDGTPVIYCTALVSEIMARSMSSPYIQMFKYTAVIAGGTGPDVWDQHIEIEAPNFFVASMRANIAKEFMGENCDVISLEQND